MADDKISELQDVRSKLFRRQSESILRYDDWNLEHFREKIAIIQSIIDIFDKAVSNEKQAQPSTYEHRGLPDV